MPSCFAWLRSRSGLLAAARSAAVSASGATPISYRTQAGNPFARGAVQPAAGFRLPGVASRAELTPISWTEFIPLLLNISQEKTNLVSFGFFCDCKILCIHQSDSSSG